MTFLARRISDRVELRPLEVWHAEAFAAHMDRAREHIRPWVGPAFVTDTVAGARATLARYAEATARDGARILGLWEGDRILGGVMFVTFDAAWGTCEVGCWLEPAAEGRGLVTRAVEAILGWAFEERGIVRAEWRCRADNERSVAVAERLGMQSEGIARSAWVFAGARYDKHVFSLLADEWAARTA